MRAIVYRGAAQRPAFIGAVMGVAVDDGGDIVEAVERVRKPGRAEILDDLDRLADQRLGNRGIMQDDEYHVGPQ